jgi:DNA repair protein RecN (Recombination protein N)
VIREGASRTEVSAEFDTPDQLCMPCYKKVALTTATRCCCAARWTSQGKSRAWINGSPATAQQLRTVGEQLMDIHGQHAWQSLTRPEAVRGLLDAYAKVSTDATGPRWLEWRQAQAALTGQAMAAQDSLQRERERLAWQIGELEKLNPQTDEWDELQTSHSRLSNGQPYWMLRKAPCRCWKTTTATHCGY